MKKSKRKTNLKSSILILLLIAILLIASTYAWFTSNRTVQVSELEVNVEARNGLQISADAVNWKSVLQVADLTGASYTGNKNQIPTVLEPVSSVGALDDAGGTMQMFYGSVNTDTDTTSPTYGQYMLTTTKETDSKGTGSTAGRYIAFDMYLKVQQVTTVYLTSSSNVIAKDATSKGLENAARVAFVTEGNVAEGTAPATIQGLTTAESTNVAIWEPNSTSHTDAAGQNAYTLYGASVSDGTAVTTEAVMAATTTPIKLIGDSTATANPTIFKAVTPKYTSTKGQTTSIGSFDLSVGVTKIRVYMWVEGQDIDCENTASGANLGFNLQISMDKT